MWKNLFPLLTFIFFAGYAVAQSNAPVTGTVRNEKAEPMPNVSVTATREGSNFRSATQTGANGSFRLELPTAGRYRIVFSHVGFAEKAETINFTGQAVALEVAMEPGLGSVNEEVVVVGYGRAARRDVTGAVKSIKSSEFNRGIINSPEELLQGKVSGVNVVSASGEPGAVQNITVRGPGGIRTGSTPLFVVDGVALDNATAGGATNPLSFINPQDIESIDVLKDASATAIYGSRGANGVVLVSTKRGRVGFSNMTYTFTGGRSSLARALPVFGADAYRSEVVKLGGTLQDFGANTDWQEEVTRKAFTQNHNLSLSGGANKFSYYGSFSMQLQEGILKGNDMKRYTGRLNLTQKLLDDRLTIDANLSAANTVNLRPDIGGLIGGAISNNPTLPARDAEGNPYRFENGINPLTLLALEKDITTINRVLGNLSGSLTITKGLVYRLNFGVDNSTADRDVQSLPNQVPLRLGRLVNLTNQNRNYLVENYLTYSGAAGDHRYTLLGGHSYQKFTLRGRGWSINNFPISGIEPIYNPGIGQELTLANNRPTGYATINELQSFFSRLNYQFRDRYLFTATVRADGSSKFGENNKYGIFPSFSAAWVLTKESFMQQSIFSSLKLRAGWGQTGNQEIPSKITQPLFTSQVSSGTSYPLYPAGAFPAGTSYTRLANPDIQWEVSTQSNIGLDFEMFRGRLSGTIDLFRKVSNNILLEVIPADPVQPASTVWTNVKDMHIINKGLELELAWRQQLSRDVNWTIGGNATFINNVVENSPYTVIPSGSASGSGLTSATINGYVNGQPIGTFFLQEFIGFDNNGLSQYSDINKDGIVNDKDRVALGSALPTKTYNFYTTFSYKRFDLSANFNGVSGNKIYDNTANAGFYKLLLSKGVNTTPAAIADSREAVNNAAPVSSRFLKNGSYLRLNNLNIGYNFNIESLGISKWVQALRLSLTGQNLFVITDYDGYDPEVNTDRTINGITSYGIDYLSYPKARTILVGFNITF